MGRSGQKVNPIGWRVGIYRKWKNSWIQNKLNYKDLLLGSINTSNLLRSFLRFGKKRRLFFFNYNLLNNNNLDIFCFFTRIKRKKMKFRQKVKKLKRYNKQITELTQQYYQSKTKLQFSRNSTIKKSVRRTSKNWQYFLNLHKRIFYYNSKKLDKKVFLSKRPLSYKKNSKIKYVLKSNKNKSLKSKKINWNFMNNLGYNLPKVYNQNKKGRQKKQSEIIRNKNKKMILRVQRKQKLFYHFFYNIEYFCLYFSFNLLSYWPIFISSNLNYNYLVQSKTFKQIFLNSFLLSNNLINKKKFYLNTKLNYSLYNKQLNNYEDNMYSKLILNKYYKNTDTSNSNFKFLQNYSLNNFYVNKKHKVGKLIKNKEINYSSNKNNFNYFSKLKFLYTFRYIQSRFIFNKIIYSNLKFNKSIIKTSNLFINRSKLFNSIKLISFNNLNTLYSIRLWYFEKQQRDFKVFNELNIYKNVNNLFKSNTGKNKKYKQSLLFHNTVKIFFKYKFLKSPLKLIKNTLSVVTGYNTDIFFSSVNSLYKFSRKKYWDPDNLKKLPDYRQKLYLKQVRTRKYELKKLTFKFYRRVSKRYIQLKNLRFLLRLCMLTSFMKRPIIFARYFCYQINKFPKKYKQIPFLKYVMSIFLTLSKRKEILGSRIQIQGRFDKWRRSKILIKESGILTTRKKFFFIEYGSASSFIRKGSFGVKVWLSYRSKFSKFYKKCLISYFNYSNFIKKKISKKKKRLNSFFKSKKNFRDSKRKGVKRVNVKVKNKKNNLYRAVSYISNSKNNKWMNKKSKINQVLQFDTIL